MNPKVLIINTVPLGFDGITMVIANYLANMDKSDIRLDVCAINHADDHLHEMFGRMGVRIVELSNRRKSPVQYFFDLFRLLKKERYDAVHIHCNSCMATLDLLCARIAGVKVIIPHSHNTTSNSVLMHKLLRPLFNKLYTHALACGQDAGKWLYGKKKGFTVLNNATDVKRFAFNQERRASMREKLGLSDADIAVGHVGFFNPQKNHKFLISVFGEVAKASDHHKLILVGQGHLMEDVKQQSKLLGIENQVVFAGRTTDVPSYLDAMDVMVLPSLFEGLPNVAIEWQVEGLPALIADTVTERCNITGDVSFYPLVSEVWVKAILSAKPTDNRTEKSKENIKKITDAGFNIEKQAEVLKNFYISAIAAKNPS